MIDINELRRLAQAATPGPWKMLPVGDGRQKFAVANSEFLSILTVTDEGGATFGTVYDDADARFIAAANPATVIELLDRIEAAESDCLEQARQNGMGASREAALMAKLEAAENERTIDEQRVADLMAELNRVGQENEELRAKVEAMEKQGPVDLNYMELRNSAQKIVESYICFRRFIANTPLENDIAALMACFVFAQLGAKGEEK